MQKPAFTASLTAPSPNTSMLFDVCLQTDNQTNSNPVTYNQHFAGTIADGVSPHLLTLESRPAYAKDHTYSASIMEERTATPASTDLTIQQLNTDNIPFYDETSVIVIMPDDQPLSSTSSASDETVLLMITPDSHKTRHGDTTTALPHHVMPPPVVVPSDTPDCSAIDPGNSLESFIRSVTDKYGNPHSTPETDQYFATVSEEQYSLDKTRFINKLKGQKEQDEYKKTLQKVRRKFKNKKSAEKTRAQQKETNQKLCEYTAEAKETIDQSKNLVRELKNHWSMPESQRDEALISSTLNTLEKVLDNAPNIIL